jgi:hypothetical protein
MLSLVNLPSEVVRHICAYLEKRDAVELSVANSTLRPFAEETIWRSISTNDTLAPYRELRQPYTSISPVGATIGIAGPDQSRLDMPKSSTCQLRQLILAYPPRQIYLKHLALQFRFDTPADLDELLIAVGPTLHSLEWRTSGPAFYASASMLAGLRVFERLDGRLTNLKRLYMTIRTDWTLTMLAIAQAAPNLEELQVNSHPRLIRNVSPTCTGPLPVTSMPRLRSLIVGNMEESFVPLLTSLIRGSKIIQRVVLEDYSFTWRPDRGDSLIHALAASTALERLTISSTLVDALEHAEGFEAVKKLSIQWGADTLGRDCQQV